MSYNYKYHLLDIIAAVICKNTSESYWVRNNLESMNNNDFECLIALFDELKSTDHESKDHESK